MLSKENLEGVEGRVLSQRLLHQAPNVRLLSSVGGVRRDFNEPRRWPGVLPYQEAQFSRKLCEERKGARLLSIFYRRLEALDVTQH
jgi:hypothetical protein